LSKRRRNFENNSGARIKAMTCAIVLNAERADYDRLKCE
jgi:hypothetical protein